MLLCRIQVQAGAGGASGSRGTINETNAAFSFQLHETVSRLLTIDGDESIHQSRLHLAHISRLRVLDHALVFLHMRLFPSDVQVVLFRDVHTGRVRSVEAKITKETISTTGFVRKVIRRGSRDSLMQELHVQDVRLGGGQAFSPIRTLYPASIHP